MESYPKIYSWGKNDKRQLSTSHFPIIYTPTPTKKVRNKQIVVVSSGNQHSAAVDTSGKLYTCGYYLLGKLGLSDLRTTTVPTFTQVSSLSQKQVLQVACGDFHTLCLLSDQKVYTWGGNLFNKLGGRPRSSDINVPAEVSSLTNKKISYVDCGIFHSVALSSTGKLYTWGGGNSQNNFGQCGHGHSQNVQQPTSLAIPGKFVKVSCGGFHTIALTSNNTLFGWGKNTLGQCGTGKMPKHLEPTVVKMPPEQRVKEISCGGHHSLVLTKSSKVYSFGHGAQGQLGLRSNQNQCEPQLVENLVSKTIVMVAAGSSHSLVLSNKGDVFACGNGNNGQLGLGKTELTRTSFSHVQELASINIQQIYTGGDHSWAIVNPKYPVNLNYRPPSPVMYTPMTSPSRSPINRSPVRYPEPLFQEFSIGVAYSDIQCSHRFIKFNLLRKEESLARGTLQQYVNQMYCQELGLKYHRIQQDNDIYEDGKLYVKRGSFSVMLVCQMSEEDKSKIGVQEPSSDFVWMTSEEISKCPQQENMSFWARYFMIQLGRFLEGPPLFVELRPLAYGI